MICAPFFPTSTKAYYMEKKKLQMHFDNHMKNYINYKMALAEKTKKNCTFLTIVFLNKNFLIIEIFHKIKHTIIFFFRKNILPKFSSFVNFYL